MQQFLSEDKKKFGVVDNVMHANGKVKSDKYDRIIKIPVTPDEGKEMLELAEKYRVDEDFYYNLYGQNCEQYLQIVLDAGNKSFALSDTWSAEDEKKTFNNLSFHTIKEQIEKDRKDFTIPNAGFEEGLRLMEMDDDRTNGWEYYDDKR